MGHAVLQHGGDMYCASVRFLVIRANTCIRRSSSCTSGESTRKWVLTPLLGQHVLVTEQPVHLANDVHAGGSCSTHLGKREHLSSSFLCPRHCTSACTWQDSGHAGVLLLEVPYLLHSEVPRARHVLQFVEDLLHRATGLYPRVIQMRSYSSPRIASCASMKERHQVTCTPSRTCTGFSLVESDARHALQSSLSNMKMGTTRLGWQNT